MPTLIREQASTCDIPVIDVFFRIGGTLTDMAVLSFIIYENVTNPGVPVQVYPTTVGVQEPVDVSDCPIGSRLSVGRYVAKYTPVIDEPIGSHFIQWFFQETVGSPVSEHTEEFLVTMSAVASGTDGYTTVASLREEGVLESVYSDTFLQGRIATATALVDAFTGRSFTPVSKTLVVDGWGRPGLLLNEPIISITEVRIRAFDVFTSDYTELDENDLRIYNRHLTQNLLSPDDRENPRLEWAYGHHSFHYHQQHSSRVHAHDWPHGKQNIEITGIFGYTDYDGTALGRTPLLIQRATNMMVIRDLPLYGDTETRTSISNEGRIIKLKTRDQEIGYSPASSATVAHQGSGFFTGDPAIDTILAMFVRPPQFGSA